ncbi:MAG: hypothetical protein MUP85_03210 [Candidatus Lokiarchaeota archaeon]|nr:hypothetical protein [Candidatus Lokiarchaeota archaeon]
MLYYFAIFFFIGYGSNILCMKLRPRWGMWNIMMRFGVLRVIILFLFFALIVFLVFVGANIPMNSNGGFLENFDNLLTTIFSFLKF